ncbi:MAG: hypothetical protein NT027_15630 [Proteobacteria bacterium]|nr:hypothetical protein [Pseudomonadota bacterium]
MRSIAIYLFVSASFNSANAGTLVGNGADSVVCYKNQNEGSIESAEVLDYFEAKSLPDIDRPNLGPESLSPSAKVRIVIDRLKSKNPFIAARLLEYAIHYESVYQFANDPLPNVSDASTPTLPINCVSRQLAVQYGAYFGRNISYIINEDLFPALNNSNRAMLELHEIVYRLAIALGAYNSDKTRGFVQYISSTRLELDSPQMVADKIKDYHLIYSPGESWTDPSSQLTWALDEKGYRTITDCEAAWGLGYHHATISELQQNLSSVMSSRLHQYIFDSASRDSAMIISSTPSGRMEECLTSGEHNSVWAIKTFKGHPEKQKIEKVCFEKAKDFSFCLR